MLPVREGGLSEPVAATSVAGLRRRLLPAAIVFAAGLTTALLWTFVLLPRFGLIDQWFDLNHFGAIGERIHRGEGFSLGHGPTLRRGPLYPYLIAGVFDVFGYTGRGSYLPVMLMQCLFAAVTCVTVYCIANRLFGQRVGLVAGLLCAAWPQCLRYVGAIDVECTMTLLITLMTLAAVRFYQETNAKNGALAGAAIAAATLTKAVALLFPLVLLALVWRRARVGRRPLPLAASAACVAVLGLLCLPWVVRNHIVSGGRFHGISSNASGEFLRGYVNARPEYVLLRTPFQGNWDYQANLWENELLVRNGFPYATDENAAGSVDFELAKERVENRAARQMVAGEPGGFLRKMGVQVFSFWYLVETPQKSLIVGAFALLALGLGIVGLRAARRAQVDATPVVATVLYFNLLYAAILAFARYSMPVYPTLMVLTANGLCALIPVRNAVPARQPDMEQFGDDSRLAPVPEHAAA